MNLITRRIKGMQDLLPIDSYKMENIEKVMKEEASLYGFKFIRTPVLEHTELFERSVGDTSDVVQKEMYTFEDKGGRSVSLRPEGTAGALRAVLENGLHNGPLPVKIMYNASCYRYEKPQAGRYREFFQFVAQGRNKNLRNICPGKLHILRLHYCKNSFHSHSKPYGRKFWPPKDFRKPVISAAATYCKRRTFYITNKFKNGFGVVIKTSDYFRINFILYILAV